MAIRYKTGYRRPSVLREGDRVAIVAPSSPFMSDELHAGLDILRECGLEPVCGDNVKWLHSRNIHAAAVDERAVELMVAFKDPSIKAVIAATGGNGSAGVLPYLDYDIIRRAGKALLGMSDITALNNGILAKAGMISVNGQSPNIRLNKGQRVQAEDGESLKRTVELMMSPEKWGTKPFNVNRLMPRVLSSGRATGHVVGGNLDTFTHLLGTSFFPDVSGAILFLEDVHKSGAALSRLFLHLQIAGVLDRVAGIVVGEFVDVPTTVREEPSPSVEEVLVEYLTNGPPCVYGYSFSHGNTTIPVPVGAACSLNADTGAVSFDFAMANDE